MVTRSPSQHSPHILAPNHSPIPSKHQKHPLTCKGQVRVHVYSFQGPYKAPRVGGLNPQRSMLLLTGGRKPRAGGSRVGYFSGCGRHSVQTSPSFWGLLAFLTSPQYLLLLPNDRLPVDVPLCPKFPCLSRTSHPGFGATVMTSF